MKIFPTNVNDLLFYNRTFEDVGEAIPISPDGTCSESFLVPNIERTKCILPSRFDVARHFMLYGGLEGLKENFTLLSTRIQSFGRYMFDLKEFPVAKNLFLSEKFVKAAQEICPVNKKVIDPFQFNFIIQIPGQTVPIHLDAPYFEDATRFQYPQWLLVAMVGSGLYKDKFIDQVQGVGYLHEWNSTRNAGQFAYFDNNDIKPVYEKPVPRSVSLLDGSKTMHAATLYKPKLRPPILPKDAKNELVFSPEKEGDETWELRSNDEILKKYHTNDLRITIVYRARCFESEEKRDNFHNWFTSGKDVRPVEVILNELKNELVEKKGYDKKTLDSMKRLELAIIYALN
uniref:Uncharacterized protein n=1 Tax=Acrobeloides nanus TaxID=290746 RepID=A0A914EA31_9BILA